MGFIQAATENERVCRQFIDGLIDRGLGYKQGLLCLIGGSSGFYNAIAKALDGYVAIQRCQWHKKENVASYLPKNQLLRQTLKKELNLEQETQYAFSAD